jgi:AcrR family transcriptional regulator
VNKHEQRSNDTKLRILEAAEISFAETGYEATSVSSICQRAGVSKGAFYHHFESKQQLFLVLLNRWLVDMDAQMANLGEGSSGVPERLVAMSGIIGQLLQVPTNQLLIYLEFINKSVRDPELWEMTIQPYHQYREVISRQVEQGMAEGSLRGLNPKTTSSMIVGMALGLLIQGYLDPTGADWNRVAKEGMGLLITGLRGTAAGDGS